MNTDDDAPLRDDVKLLGRLLGEVLREQGGAARYELVEQTRVLARALRRGGENVDKLDVLLRGLKIEDGLFVARAFTHFLALANVAEQHHRVRRHGLQQETAALETALTNLLASGVDKRQLQRTASALSIEIVLTAHPTEVSRRTLLQKYDHIAELLQERDQERERAAPIEDELRREIATLWLTDEIRRERPTPEDEARAGWVAIEQSLWTTLPRFIRAFDASLMKTTGQGLPPEAVPIRFGSWMGGDRDGNPNVTAVVTRRVCLLSRWMASDLYLRDIEALRQSLSLNVCSDEMRKEVQSAHEPYRVYLKQVRDKLRRTRDWLQHALDTPDAVEPDDIYSDTQDLLAPLLLCDRSLRASNATLIAEGLLRDVIIRVRAFGLALVKLDIRQESTRHTACLSEITRALALGDYAEWSEDKRREFLLSELNNPRPLLPRHFEASTEAREVLDTFAVAAALGRESLGAYVISMARQASDVLAVALLQKEAGGEHPQRIVPLFETITDLQSAEATLRDLFAMPWYRAFTHNAQEVMIGYSDSAKDRGRLTAAWTLYEAQARIAKLCDESGITLTLFHGRGGSVGRGGGSTILALQAQPPGTVAGRLRVTEQGEMIQAKLAMSGVALRTLELYTTATLQSTLQPATAPKTHWQSALTTMSKAAADAYVATVKNNADFIPYFKEATPIDELSTLNIGSRPARRKALHGVEGLRAIPWVFAWTQTRLHLPVWLGISAALKTTPLSLQREMYRDWPFFRATFELVAMVLAKSEPHIAAHYDELLVDAKYKPLGQSFRAQLAELTQQVLQLTEQGGNEPSELLKPRPSLARAIEVRNPYIDPLNVLQSEFLRRSRQGDESQTLRDALMISINGIANGMRNTG